MGWSTTILNLCRLKYTLMPPLLVWGAFLITSVTLSQSQKNFQNYSIVHLEMINILVALKVWAYQWKDKKIRIKCDNMPVVEVLTSGKTKDGVLGCCWISWQQQRH